MHMYVICMYNYLLHPDSRRESKPQLLHILQTTKNISILTYLVQQ